MSPRGPYRLPTGGAIDRSRAIEFQFDGRQLAGYHGDTVASALLANGVRIVSRSFKFHRPRGVFSAGIEEPNALVKLHDGALAVPSARATVTALSPGLEVRSQNGWPGVRFDVLRALDFMKPVFAAGFYHKAFIWPSWHLYEDAVRHLAGLGRVPSGADPSRYALNNVHCDVLVVGAGVAGLQAALRAGEAGSRVLLVEQDAEVGGQSRWDGSAFDAALIARVKALPNVRMLTRTTAVSAHDRQIFALSEQVGDDEKGVRERYWIVRTRQTVFATGAFEQPLIFTNNDRPGIMLTGAARRYLSAQAIVPGYRIVVATNNDSAYATAIDLQRAGAHVSAMLDSRSAISPAIAHSVASLGIPLHLGTMPVDTAGFSALNAVICGRLTQDGAGVAETWRVPTDALLVSGGWVPALQLYAQAGGRLQYRDDTGSLEPVEVDDDWRIAGLATASAYDIGPRISPVGATSRQWVDLRHDVTVADLELAQRENFTSIEHVKRYTTVGMSADQGKTSNVAALQIVAGLRGVKAATLGYTTYRPPFTPVTFGAIAGAELGEQFAPSRQTPMHAWHLAHDGVMQDYGEWQRPVAYVRSGESRAEAIRREALAVRTGVGLFDASSLGKIEVHGPDAKEFLNRFYINNLLTLQPGKVRYVLMLRESGVVFDDGTVVALAPDRLLVTTTSGNALRVGAWLEEWRQCEWPELRVRITPVTDQWATIALTGREARSVLARLKPDFDIAQDAFPHMSLREGRVMGHRARVYRVSFSGELTYEINVPADVGPQLWQALLAEGAGAGIVPYGLDALLLLRLEKGFLHIGADTDGTTVPDDIGFGTIAANKQSHYIGKRSLSLPESVRIDRLQLIGLAGLSNDDLPIGSHLKLTQLRSGCATDGWITSTGRSTLEGRPLALAMLRGGRACLGQTVTVHDSGSIVARATVVNPPFYDVAGARMHG